MAKYQKQEAILKGRSSYNKTNPGVTLKDDHMQNGQQKTVKWKFNWLTPNKRI